MYQVPLISTIIIRTFNGQAGIAAIAIAMHISVHACHCLPTFRHVPRPLLSRVTVAQHPDANAASFPPFSRQLLTSLTPCRP